MTIPQPAADTPLGSSRAQALHARFLHAIGTNTPKKSHYPGDKTYLRPHPPRHAEDGTLKRTAALILALAAALLFAPVARADADDATHPYRIAVDPAPDGTSVGTADDDGEDDDEGSDDDGGSSEDDDQDDGDDEDEGSDDDGEDDDDGSNPPVDQSPPEGPTASALGPSGMWLGLLIVVLAGIAAGAAVVLRRRMTQNR
jgi:hypothetical protein